MTDLMNIFMNLATEHTRVHTASLESDIYMGYQMGLEKAMMALAELPELSGDYGVQSVTERLTHSLPALASTEAA